MPNIMRWIAPKNEKFLEILANQSENVLEGAKQLKEFIDDYSKVERSERKSKAQAIKNIGHKCDEISHDLIEKLNKNFRTSIGKQEIHQITVLLDEVMNLIGTVALRFVLLGIERIDTHIIKLVDIIHSAASELNKSILDLKKSDGMKEHYIKIRSLENEADDVYHGALSELFHFYKNSIDIIKYKEIYELLEDITDKCEDVANIMKRYV